MRKKKDKAVVKYSVLAENKKLFASKYLVYLPKEEDLKQLIEQDRQLFEMNRAAGKKKEMAPLKIKASHKTRI